MNIAPEEEQDVNTYWLDMLVPVATAYPRDTVCIALWARQTPSVTLYDPWLAVDNDGYPEVRI